jgi:hypothetical protein
LTGVSVCVSVMASRPVPLAAVTREARNPDSVERMDFDGLCLARPKVLSSPATLCACQVFPKDTCHPTEKFFDARHVDRTGAGRARR